MKKMSMFGTLLLLALALGCAAASRGTPDVAGVAGAVKWSAGPVRTEAGVQIQDLDYLSDGLHIKGYLFTPAPLSAGGADLGGGRRPGVVFNHGGVSGISKDMIRRSGDLVRAGYVVIIPAYRGEGGSEGKVEVAAGEVDDVLNAAEILRHHSAVDPDRLALIGSSHGALVSVLAAARDPRFQAVVEACGVMDVDAWYRYLVENGFDVSDSLSRAVYGSGPEDRPEAFHVRNAILVAPKFQPPLLLQQGLKDRTVPPDQPWRMATALTRAGRPNFHVLTYSLLGHAFWFWNDPKSHTPEELEQADRSWTDMLEFLNSHLKSGTEESPDMTAETPEQGGRDAARGKTTDYRTELREWEKARVLRLIADDGWLTVTGLFWLKPGGNTFGSDSSNAIVLPASSPAKAGSFLLEGDSVFVRVSPDAPVTFEGKPVTGPMRLTTDADGNPEVLALHRLRMFVIKRTKGYAIRLRDLDAPARSTFAMTGIQMFPADATWRFDARFVPYDPAKPIEIPSIIGTVDTMLSHGYVEFERAGKTYRLDPVLESKDADELFFIFKDATS